MWGGCRRSPKHPPSYAVRIRESLRRKLSAETLEVPMVGVAGEPVEASVTSYRALSSPLE